VKSGGELRRTSRRSRPRDTGPSAEVVDLVLDRDHTRCAACGELVSGGRGEGWSVHHRLRRGAGSTRRPWVNLPANLLLTCGHGTVGCHSQIESQRIWAEAAGFIVRDGITLPSAVPVQHAVHGLVRLLDDGTWEAA
jgi:hypothetical protein